MKFAIVGAGLSGRLLAWQLLEAGHHVSLFDKDQGQAEHSAAIVAAAMLAPYSEVLDAEPVVYQQGLRGFAIWQDWAQQLLATTGIDIDLRLTGSVVLAHRQDGGDFQHFYQRLRAHSAIDQSAVELLDQTGLRNVEPELTPAFSQACYLHEEGCLDNAALLQALALRLRQLSCDWHTAICIDKIADHSQGVLAGFDKVIDCRGIGARAEISDLRGVRGEIIKVHAPEVNLSRPVRLMHPRYKLYISPKLNHHYVIGATQIESNAESPITVRSSLELLSALYSVHSGFSEAQIISQSAKCRPAFLDNLPRIRHCDSHIELNGLHRHGYLLSPVVVTECLSQLLGGESLWPEIVVTEARDKLKKVSA